MSPPPLRPVVFAEADSPGATPAFERPAARTARALRLAGLDPVLASTRPLADLAPDLASGPVWLVRAGSWPVLPPAALPPPSRTGRPLCALGRTVAAPDGAPPDETPAAWDALLAATGGDLDDAVHTGAPLPRPDSVYLEAPLSRALAELLTAHSPSPAPPSSPALPLSQRASSSRPPLSLEQALSRLLRTTPARVVSLPTLDVFSDAVLRVAQVVTSIQQGGAERVALDLAGALGLRGVASRLFTVWRPSRRAFALPPGAADLSMVRGDRDRRFAVLAAELAAWGADLAHTHLFPREDLTRLASHGYRSLVTVHNMSPGWPPGLDTVDATEAVLLVGCARAVEADLIAASVHVPTRSVWNGITPPPPRDRTAARRALGLSPDDLVLLTLANPRPQKRLHLLPALLAAVKAHLAEAGDPRRVTLVLAGDTSPVSAAAIDALAAFQSEVTRLALADHVLTPGSVGDVAPFLAACDVLVSPSAHEGLSLAHLEALSAGRPVVATGTGGTAELAALTPAVTFVPEEAGLPGLADAVLSALRAPPPGGPRTQARHFTVPRMAEAYARLYPRAALVASRAQESRSPSSSPSPANSHSSAGGVLLVTNNFSTGGAQSSARRLLLGLAARGIPARAAVLEEQPGHPTPGRTALLEAGIPVLAVPPPAVLDAGDSASRLLAWMEHHPPAAVIFWNTLAEHKVLLAETLFDLPVFDVSPGEMYFDSLARHFTSPRDGQCCRSPRDYGARLAGVFVKYRAEADLAARVLGAPVHVVPNGIPFADAVPLRDRSPLVFGTAARIHPHKRLADLLAAVRLAAPRLPPFRLRIAGAPDRGQEAHAAELRAASADLPVDWVGEVPGSAAFLADLDVFVLVAEPAGCPNASLEALAAGLPVIATDVGGMSEQIEDGTTGRLVPREDPAALAEAMVSVAADSALRARLARAGRAHVRAHFSMDGMIEAYRRALLGPRD